MNLNTELKLQNYNGTLALCGPSLITAHNYYASHIPSPSFLLHITLLTPAEYKRIGKPSIKNVNIPVQHVYVLGLGRKSDRVQWLVVTWNHANKWRKELGLPPREFHITLSTENDWNAAKGVPSLLSGGVDRSTLLQRFLGLGEEGMDHVVMASEGSEMHDELAQLAICHFPCSYRGYVRLAELKYHTQPKTSLLCYARAVSLNPQLRRRVVKRMLAMRDAAAYGPLVSADELASIPADLALYVLHPFPHILHEELGLHLWTFNSLSRKRQLYLGKKELPRFFTWLYPHRLSGMSTPRTVADIELLQEMGITHVLTLTEETPLPAAWFAFRPISNLFVPIANYHSPTLAEMDSIYKHVQEGGTWLVHCGGGKGRAGVVLSCLIAMFGLDPAFTEDKYQYTPQMDGRTAIRTLRSLRPGSLETDMQEDFVTQWLSHRWRRAHNAMDVIGEPWAQLQQDVDRKSLMQGVQPGAADVLFLVGKPGSGKTWFSDSLTKRRPRASTVVISQDECGSRATCESMLGRPYPPDTLVIVDRCNPEAANRKSWMALIQPARRVIGVHFDYSLELCRQRVDQRLNHPTIRAGRGGPALRQMDKLMAPPTLAEGFAAVLTIASFAASKEAVILLGGHPTITKFPRTMHLLNLGATTPDDLVQAEFKELRNVHLTLEEKIDGANMGFSLDYDRNLLVQNRSHYISYAEHAQFRPLKAWLDHHESALCALLHRDPQFPERYVLYGEWCVAQHSIAYRRLPAPFLAFDLFDRFKGTFLSRRTLTTALEGTGIHQVPLIAERDNLTREHLVMLMKRRSEYADGPVEGVYVRFEDAERRITVDRSKVVRGDFVAGNEHWTRRPLVYNKIVRVGQDD